MLAVITQASDICNSPPPAKSNGTKLQQNTVREISHHLLHYSIASATYIYHAGLTMGA